MQSEQQKVLYALGLALSKTLDRMNVQEAELAYLVAGLQDGVLGRPPRLSLEEYNEKAQELARERLASASEREKARARQFLVKMAAEPGAERTESGIVIVPQREGTGPAPARTDTVRVNFQGTLPDGTVFDSSLRRGRPAILPLDEVIPCWIEALQRMKVGGRMRVACPPELAYGDEGGRGVPPNSAIVFDIHLLGIGDAPAAVPGRTGEPLPQQVASLR
jgi:FKBP-type peptidyl-prolyl cis-trans isomerase